MASRPRPRATVQEDDKQEKRSKNTARTLVTGSPKYNALGHLNQPPPAKDDDDKPKRKRR